MSTALTVAHPPKPETFDYSMIDTEVAANLRRQAQRIRKRISSATQDLIDIGHDLEAAKRQLLNHGEFVKWVESEVGIVRRTAQAYMAIARLADDKGAAIALLPPTTVHRLAAKSAPPDVVSEVVAKAKSGDVLPDRTVSEMISEAKLKKTTSGQEEISVPGRQSVKNVQVQQRHNAEMMRAYPGPKTCKTADVLFKALSLENVELIVKVFSEEEWPWDLLFALRQRIAVANAAVGTRHHDATH
jgi:hypothetical protein